VVALYLLVKHQRGATLHADCIPPSLSSLLGGLLLLLIGSGRSGDFLVTPLDYQDFFLTAFLPLEVFLLNFPETEK
jgi:hypothetical protein